MLRNSERCDLRPDNHSLKKKKMQASEDKAIFYTSI